MTLAAGVPGPVMKKITVLDGDFKVVKVIADPAVLAAAGKEWGSLVPITLAELPDTRWTHKIDIVSETIGGRWLYNKKGYLGRLNKLLKPLYRVKDVSRFNRIFLNR